MRERIQTAAEHNSSTEGGEQVITGRSMGVDSEPLPSSRGFGLGMEPILPSAFLAHQLPPLAPRDTSTNAETIEERFEMLAAERRWTT